MSILNATHLKKYYGKDESLVKALDDVNVSVENGQFVAIIGTSGSGKSTLLNMLGGLDTPTSGGVQVEDKSLEKLTEEQLTVFRRQRIGFIFQNYNLIPCTMDFITIAKQRMSVRNTDIGPRQYGSVIDTVPNKGQHTFFAFLLQQAFHTVNLISRE